MKFFVRNTSLDGKPLTGDGEVFTGERPLDVVMAMKGTALFSDYGSVPEYVDMVLRNAKMLAGIELTVSGDGPEALAESLLAALVEHGLAEVLEEKPSEPPESPTPVPIPDAPADWLAMHLAAAQNSYRWSKSPELQKWLYGSRLDGFAAMFAHASRQGAPDKLAIIDRYLKAIRPGTTQLAKLMAVAG